MQYQPNIGEIRPTIEAMTDRYPQLDTRAQRAEAILLNGDFDFMVGAWYVPSARDENAAYQITDQGCNCPDFASGAPVANGRKLCKHRLAVDVLTSILTAHLNYYPSLSVDIDFNVLSSTGDHICRCQTLADESFVFERSADAAKFSEWLYDAPIIRVPVEILMDYVATPEQPNVFFMTETGAEQDA